jgi:hypothetical protein
MIWPSIDWAIVLTSESGISGLLGVDVGGGKTFWGGTLEVPPPQPIVNTK